MTGIIMPVYGAATTTTTTTTTSVPTTTTTTTTTTGGGGPPISCVVQNAFVTGISPSSGTVGSTAIISGYFPAVFDGGLQGTRVTNVTFGTQYAAFTASETQITVTVPSGSGTVSVQVYNGCTPLMAPLSFTYATITTTTTATPTPSITSLTTSTDCNWMYVNWNGINYSSYKLDSGLGWFSPITSDGNGAGSAALYVGGCSTTRTGTLYLYSGAGQTGSATSQAFTNSTTSCSLCGGGTTSTTTTSTVSTSTTTTSTVPTSTTTTSTVPTSTTTTTSTVPTSTTTSTASTTSTTTTTTACDFCCQIGCFTLESGACAC